MADLGTRLIPFAENIRSLAQSPEDEHAVTFACAIYADGEEDFNQEVSLGWKTICLLGALGASLWVDVCFPGARGEDG